PNYSWMVADDLHSWDPNEEKATGQFIQRYCDILNAAAIDGRTNWSWAQTLTEHDYPGSHGWYNNEGRQYYKYYSPLPAAVTDWMREALEFEPRLLGQGWLDVPSNGLRAAPNRITYVHQVNQFGDTNSGNIQGDQWPPSGDDWHGVKGYPFQNQFITCFSGGMD
ncbi:hypothetical protein, partial [Photobacterium damselae]|uniref:hypothetical protein n=1 Tax=Photobacterium damselae TaxID=38293 RepID=UPI001EFDDF7E